MKKIIVTILAICLCAVTFVGCKLGETANADKYDKENYIGAADISKEIEEFGITREELSAFTIEGDIASMNGDISADTIRQVKKLIKDYPEVKTIKMIYVGGSIDDESNLIASRLVREAGLNTYVAKDGHIASGGTDFFCAGVKRTAEEGAKIGVHSWAGGDITNAALLPKDDENHKKYIDYYKEMSMSDPEGFYFFTINAAVANDMYYMSMDELVKFGLVTE